MKLPEANLDVKLNTLHRNPFFDDLPEDMLKAIAERMQLRGFERGEILFWEDDRGGYVAYPRQNPSRFCLESLIKFWEEPARTGEHGQRDGVLSGHESARAAHQRIASRGAAQLGTVREVVGRSLKELERSGAIRIEDRRIHIADDNVLRPWSQPN